MHRRILTTFAVGAAVLGIGVTPAFAYLDPGSGSFVLQMLLASLLAVGVSAKMFWYRIKETAHRILGRSSKPHSEAD